MHRVRSEQKTKPENRGRRIAPPRARLRRWPWAILCPLSCLLVLSGGVGCGALGALAYKVSGPPSVRAQYVPAKEPMLVLVENARNPAASRLDSEWIGRQVVEQLKQKKIAPTIDSSALDEFRAGKDYGSVPVPAVGRAVGAAQVLYVDLQNFAIEGTVGNDMLKGRADARVRVVDARTGQTRWPTDTAEGYPLNLETPWLRTGVDTTEPALREQLGRTLSDRIAKLFYKWKAEDEGGEGLQ